MKTTLLTATLLAFTISAFAQNHGSITYKGQTIPHTNYRTREKDGKRWIIADGKKDGKMYSLTVTLRPDMTTGGSIKTDTTHTATLTVSNEDYSNAQNYCFDGGSSMTVTPQSSKLAVSGKDMQSGNCFGKSAGSDKLTFVMKP